MKNKLYEMYLNLRINRTEKAIKKFEKLILECLDEREEGIRNQNYECVSVWESVYLSHFNKIDSLEIKLNSLTNKLNPAPLGVAN